MTSVIAFVITVDWLCCEANCQTLLGGDDIVLSYYFTNRVTPVYIFEEELMSLEYSKFVEHIVNEVLHLRRMNSLRLTVKEDETVDVVDLSRKYFSLQMNALLDKGSKSIRIRVFEFASPAVDNGIDHRIENMAETGAEDRELTRMHVRHSLNLQIDREISLLVGYLLHQ